MPGGGSPIGRPGSCAPLEDAQTDRNKREKKMRLAHTTDSNLTLAKCEQKFCKPLQIFLQNSLIIKTLRNGAGGGQPPDTINSVLENLLQWHSDLLFDFHIFLLDSTLFIRLLGTKEKYTKFTKEKNLIIRKKEALNLYIVNTSYWTTHLPMRLRLLSPCVTGHEAVVSFRLVIAPFDGG